MVVAQWHRTSKQKDTWYTHARPLPRRHPVAKPSYSLRSIVRYHVVFYETRKLRIWVATDVDSVSSAPINEPDRHHVDPPIECWNITNLRARHLIFYPKVDWEAGSLLYGRAGNVLKPRRMAQYYTDEWYWVTQALSSEFWVCLHVWPFNKSPRHSQGWPRKNRTLSISFSWRLSPKDIYIKMSMVGTVNDASAPWDQITLSW
jgi:hypothetical protein